MEIYSANEYWVKAASLLHTTPDGTRDLPDSPFARNYFISSHQHGTGNSASKGNCQQFQNPLNSAAVQRGLWIAMDQWITKGQQPPNSRVPMLSDGTLVPPVPQTAMGFPKIPGVTYTGLKTTRYRYNFGDGFYETGIATINPPVITPPYEDNSANGPIYPSFIPKTDSDGNDIAGIRLADVTVPVATYTGWALRSGPQANDGCESSGQFIPFPKTSTERLNKNDPRLSTKERYDWLDQYVSKVAQALQTMINERLLLCEDYDAELNRLTTLGATTGGLTMAPAGQAIQPPPPPASCQKKHGDETDD
jgi:Alpha/beta hydrolase domain